MPEFIATESSLFRTFWGAYLALAKEKQKPAEQPTSPSLISEMIFLDLEFAISSGSVLLNSLEKAQTLKEQEELITNFLVQRRETHGLLNTGPLGSNSFVNNFHYTLAEAIAPEALLSQLIPIEQIAGQWNPIETDLEITPPESMAFIFRTQKTPDGRYIAIALEKFLRLPLPLLMQLVYPDFDPKNYPTHFPEFQKWDFISVNHLTQEEIYRLKNSHADLTDFFEDLDDFYKQLQGATSPKEMLHKLIGALRSGSSHGGAGTIDNASVEAYKGIQFFIKYFKILPQEMQDDLGALYSENGQHPLKDWLNKLTNPDPTDPDCVYVASNAIESILSFSSTQNMYAPLGEKLRQEYSAEILSIPPSSTSIAKKKTALLKQKASLKKITRLHDSILLPYCEEQFSMAVSRLPLESLKTALRSTKDPVWRERIISHMATREMLLHELAVVLLKMEAPDRRLLIDALGPFSKIKCTPQDWGRLKNVFTLYDPAFDNILLEKIKKGHIKLTITDANSLVLALQILNPNVHTQINLPSNSYLFSNTIIETLQQTDNYGIFLETIKLHLTYLQLKEILHILPPYGDDVVNTFLPIIHSTADVSAFLTDHPNYSSQLFKHADIIKVLTDTIKDVTVSDAALFLPHLNETEHSVILTGIYETLSTKIITANELSNLLCEIENRLPDFRIFSAEDLKKSKILDVIQPNFAAIIPKIEDCFTLLLPKNSWLSSARQAILAYPPVQAHLLTLVPTASPAELAFLLPYLEGAEFDSFRRTITDALASRKNEVEHDLKKVLVDMREFEKTTKHTPTSSHRFLESFAPFGMIKNISDLKALLEDEDPKTQQIILKALMSKLPEFIDNLKNLNSILQSTSSDAHLIILEAIKSKLPNMIDNLDNLNSILASKNSNIQLIILEAAKSKLPNMITHPHYMVLIFKNTNPVLHPIVLQAITSELSQLILDSSDLTSILAATNNPDAKQIILNSIMPQQFVKIIKTNNDLIAVMGALNDATNIKMLLSCIKNQLPAFFDLPKLSARELVVLLYRIHMHAPNFLASFIEKRGRVAELPIPYHGGRPYWDRLLKALGSKLSFCLKDGSDVYQLFLKLPHLHEELLKQIQPSKIRTAGLLFTVKEKDKNHGTKNALYLRYILGYGPEILLLTSLSMLAFAFASADYETQVFSDLLTSIFEDEWFSEHAGEKNGSAATGTIFSLLTAATVQGAKKCRELYQWNF